MIRTLTVEGSSRGFSISAWRKNTFPRHALHNMRSNAGIRSRRITPATKLDCKNQKSQMYKSYKYVVKKCTIIFLLHKTYVPIWFKINIRKVNVLKILVK